jgi:hypothetical protein
MIKTMINTATRANAESESLRDTNKGTKTVLRKTLARQAAIAVPTNMVRPFAMKSSTCSNVTIRVINKMHKLINATTQIAEMHCHMLNTFLGSLTPDYSPKTFTSNVSWAPSISVTTSLLNSPYLTNKKELAWANS